MLNELDRLNAEQVIRFPTCVRKTLDVVFAKDLVVNAQIDEKFTTAPITDRSLLISTYQ